MNSFICTGTLIRDVELYETKNKNYIAKIFVVVKNNDRQDCFETVLLGEQAKKAKEELCKDDTIVIEGEIHNRYWYSSKGENRVKTEIKITKYTKVGKNGTKAQNEQTGNQ